MAEELNNGDGVQDALGCLEVAVRAAADLLDSGEAFRVLSVGVCPDKDVVEVDDDPREGTKEGRGPAVERRRGRLQAKGHDQLLENARGTDKRSGGVVAMNAEVMKPSLKVKLSVATRGRNRNGPQ